MKALIWIIILFAAATGIALAVQNFQGSVHFILGETIYSLNIYTLIIGLIIIWALWYFLLRLLKRIVGIPHFLSRFNKKRHIHQAEYLLNEIGMAFFEGRYQKAQHLAEKMLKNQQATEKLPLALILAAYSADEADDATARDGFLATMEKLPQYNPLPVHLLLAKSALIKKDLPLAQEHIQAALSINSNLTQALKLDLRYALEKADAETVMKHQARLYKNGALSDKEAENYRLFVYRQRLAAAQDSKGMKRCLKTFPEKEKSHTLLLDIAHKYRELSLFPEVIKWIEQHYPESQNRQLLTILNEVFPLLSPRLQKRILNQAEGWLKQDEQNVALLFALGQMTMQEELWGKAKGYLEKGLAIEQDVAAYLNLAKVLSEMNQEEAAKENRLHALDLIEQGEKLAEENEEDDDTSSEHSAN